MPHRTSWLPLLTCCCCAPQLPQAHLAHTCCYCPASLTPDATAPPRPPLLPPLPSAAVRRPPTTLPPLSLSQRRQQRRCLDPRRSRSPPKSSTTSRCVCGGGAAAGGERGVVVVVRVGGHRRKGIELSRYGCGNVAAACCINMLHRTVTHVVCGCDSWYRNIVVSCTVPYYRTCTDVLYRMPALLCSVMNTCACSACG